MLADHRPRQRHPEGRRRLGAGIRPPAYSRPRGAVPTAHRCPRGKKHRAGLVVLVTAPAIFPARDELLARCGAFPRCAQSLGRQPVPRRSEPADVATDGESDRGGLLVFASGSGRTRSSQTTRRWRNALRARCRVRRPAGMRPSTPLLWHRSIGLSMARRALTVWGIDVSEESVACAIEKRT